MWDFLGILVNAVVDIIALRWWYGDTNEEHRGCFWSVVFFVALCAVIAVIVWMVMQ